MNDIPHESDQIIMRSATRREWGEILRANQATSWSTLHQIDDYLLHVILILRTGLDGLTMELITSINFIVLSACLFTTYLVGLALYRLYFSPLARFPGPKLAALTLWYEFYYDVIKRGRYTWKIAELHKQYGEPLVEGRSYRLDLLITLLGPILRISPHELHIDDPKYSLPRIGS